MALLAVGCGSTVDDAGASCETEGPPGYCEDDPDCDDGDRCWLTRTLDSHLQGPDETISINRCIPRQREGDYCEVGWCELGLTCDAAPDTGKGICVRE